MMRDSVTVGVSVNEAYLDIETTGLSLDYDYITVVGISRGGRLDRRVEQLVSPDISAYRIMQMLKGVQVVYTFGGSNFDLPFLKRHYGIDGRNGFRHRDLRYECRRRNLCGGLKTVERQLGICRVRPDVDGREAVRLWWRYRNHYDYAALQLLLDYNREDVLNLKTLKQLLVNLPPVII